MLVSISEIATELARGLDLRKNPTTADSYEEIVVSSPSTSSSVAWRKSCLSIQNYLVSRICLRPF
jgi:hypothetical protein